MERPFPKAAIILLLVVGFRFLALSKDLASFQWEGMSSNQWYNQYYTPLTTGVSNVSTVLMNGGVGSLVESSIKSLSSITVMSTRSNNEMLNKSTRQQRRILLGISTKDYLDKAERQHRRIIRDTWLEQSFHDDPSDESASQKVCSLHKLLQSSTAEDDCQLVFTFLFPNQGNQTTNVEELLDVYTKYRGDSKANEALLTGIPQESKHDAFFVSVDNPKNQYQVLLEWTRMVVQLSSNSRSVLGSFDYVGFATTQALVFPQRLWKENNAIFQSTLPHESMVAGMLTEEVTEEDFPQSCSQSFCLDPNFLLLSKDVVQHLAATTTRVSLDTEDNAPTTMDAASLASSKLFQYFQEYKRGTGFGVSWKLLVGIQRASKSPENVISAWDKYVATVSNYRQPRMAAEPQDEYPHAPVTTYEGNPRMLVGIFTTNLKPIERKRRNALRQTFIKAYDHTPTPHRICSLQQLLTKQFSEEECQLAYTFVIGAGKKNVPMVNVNANSTEDMAIPSSQIKEPESDVLYLNIKENMNDGKSESWFKYATLLSENQLYFDYITKMDTDTVLLPYPMFEKMAQWPKYPNNLHVYGGHYVVKQDAVQRAVTVLGTSYMDGPLYWLSPDVARFISDPNRCNHTELRTHAEDMSIGNYVNSFPYPIHRLTLSNKCYAHPLKRLEHYRKRWKRYKTKFKQYHP